MNCEAYQALLTTCLEEGFTPEAEEQLRRHEAQCPDCAALRASLEALPDSLASLETAVPPMPEGLHQRWTEALKGENNGMENREKTGRTRHGFGRGALAVAAALVLLIGGTVWARDSLPGRRTASPAAARTDAGQNAAKTSAPAYGASAYANGAADYETPFAAAEADMADYDTPMEEAETEGAAGGVRGAAQRETKLIRNVSLTIATRTFEESYEALRGSAGDGWISYSSVSTSSNGLRTASLTLRIPADQVDAFLAGTGSFGRVTRQEETTQDVTDSYYDTQSRLETQKALLSRYQELVAKAEDMSDLLTLENAMAEIQWQIDSYTASLNATDSRVQYATISVTLREEKEQERVQVTELGFGERISAALAVGWEALTDFLEDMAVFLIAALPVILLIRRKRRKQRGAE